MSPEDTDRRLAGLPVPDVSPEVAERIRRLGHRALRDRQAPLLLSPFLRVWRGAVPHLEMAFLTTCVMIYLPWALRTALGG